MLKDDEMGGAVIGTETTLLPFSLVLKEIHLPTATYEGRPAEPVSGVQFPSPLITQPRPSGGHDWQLKFGISYFFN